MAATLNPDTHPGKVYAVLQLAAEPLTVDAIAAAAGIDKRASTTAVSDLTAYGHALRFPGERVRYWRVPTYPDMPRPRWPDKLRARLIADLGPRVTRVA